MSDVWLWLGSPVASVVSTVLLCWLFHRIGYDSGWKDGVDATRKRWVADSWERYDRERSRLRRYVIPADKRDVTVDFSMDTPAPFATFTVDIGGRRMRWDGHKFVPTDEGAS